MGLVKQQDEFLRDVVRLLTKAWDTGFTVTGGELWRTREQQQIYLETGRTKTKNSYHLKRLAVDLNFFREGQVTMGKEDLQGLGDYWEELSEQNRWGGNWSFYDGGHFERREE